MPIVGMGTSEPKENIRMTFNILKYRRASDAFLEQAFAELDAGDLRQASEKGWGAAVEVVKAVAEQRGWDHKRHEDLYIVVDSIATEIRDSVVRSQFNNAGQLHTNFYEGWLAEGNVREGLNEVRRFVERVALLLEG